MANAVILRVIAGALAVIVLGFIVFRRKKTA
jgi:LPXTG-motif cell wall-anchored protein